MNIEGMSAIVTGGGTGVGRATGIELAKRGCSVLVNYSRSKNEAESTVAEIEAIGAKAIPYLADVSDDQACRDMVSKAVQEFGQLNILVNSAGTTSFIEHPNLEDVKDEDWDRVMAVNLKGPFQCSRAARGPIEEAGEGEIVNVASTAGIVGIGSSIPYCASKAALINLTLVLARVLGPKIRVNAVAPGFISGRWLEQGLGKEAYEMMKAFVENRAALRKGCDPSDVADAIIGLITGSDLVTAQTLIVDGGLFTNYMDPG